MSTKTKLRVEQGRRNNRLTTMIWFYQEGTKTTKQEPNQMKNLRKKIGKKTATASRMVTKTNNLV